MRTISTPPAGKGRRPILGTVIADHRGRMVLVKLCYSLAHNTGNTGSPRVEVWVALREHTLIPVVVRRTDMSLKMVGEWQRHRMRDYPLRRDDCDAALRACGYTPASVRRAKRAGPDWALSPSDTRVILPDHPEFPKNPKWLRAGIVDLLARRNTCHDAAVWAIDAQILSLAPRVKQPAIIV